MKQQIPKLAARDTNASMQADMAWMACFTTTLTLPSWLSQPTGKSHTRPVCMAQSLHTWPCTTKSYKPHTRSGAAPETGPRPPTYRTTNGPRMGARCIGAATIHQAAHDGGRHPDFCTWALLHRSTPSPSDRQRMIVHGTWACAGGGGTAQEQHTTIQQAAHDGQRDLNLCMGVHRT